MANMKINGVDSQLSEEKEDLLKDTFIRHNDFIVDRMLPDFGLIDKLYSDHALTNMEKSKIKAWTTIQERNQSILDCINQKNLQRTLIDALLQFKQKHLINYLKSDGVFKSGFGEDWPLTKKEISTLDSNFVVLVDLLDTNEVGRLYQAEVINIRQRDFISSKATPSDKNEALLEILRRGSIHSYRQTVRWLQVTNQGHIAKILDEGGVVVPVHSHIEPASEQTEDEIINSFANTLRNLPLEEARRIFDTAFNVLALKKGQSIVIYILCKTLADLKQLKELLLNGKLKLAVKKLFAELLCQAPVTEVTGGNLKSVADSVSTLVYTQRKIKDVDLTFSEKAFQEYTLYFSRAWKGIVSEILISEIPLELLDIILKKVYLFSILPKYNSPEERDEDVIKNMLSVDFCWFKRITKKSFKTATWSYLRKYYKTKLSSPLINKLNKQFVQENFQSIKQPIRLKRFDCLSDIESAIINRKTFLKKSKDKRISKRFMGIPALAKYSDDIKLNAFVRCLRRCGERFMERIICNTEAVIKVEFRNMISSAKQKPKRRKLSTLSYKASKIFSQMKDDQLQILKTFEDRETVVWVWINSPEALKSLPVANDYKRFHEQILKMVKEKFCIETSGIFNIDSDQLHKEFELFTQMVGNINTTLEFKFEHDLYRIAKLRNNIFILICNSPGYFIEIYEDRRPFSMLKRIKIKDLEEIFAFISNGKDNCVHVFGHDTSNVIRMWLIRETDSGRAFEVSEPKTAGKLGDFVTGHPRLFVSNIISMCTEGEMMIVDNDQQPVNLIFFGSKGEHLRSISLHKDILRVHSAVQTSTGHFVILCKKKKSLSRTKIKKGKNIKNGKDCKTHGADMNADARDKHSAIDIKSTDLYECNDDDGNQYDDDLNKEIICKVSPNGKRIICYFDLEALGISRFLNPFLSIDAFDCVFLTDRANRRLFLFDPNLRRNQFLNILEKLDIGQPIGSFHDYEKKQLIVQYFDGFKIFTLSLK